MKQLCARRRRRRLATRFRSSASPTVLALEALEDRVLLSDGLLGVLGAVDDPETVSEEFQLMTNPDRVHEPFAAPQIQESNGAPEAGGGPDPGPLGWASSFDLRPTYVTSVKDQGYCGSCWSFATYGSLESSILVEGGPAQDLSENHLKNYHGFDLGPCQGGYSYFGEAYLTRWSGPVSEADDPYNPSDDRPSPGGPAQYYVEEVLRFDTDDEMKYALTNYGALYTNMCWMDTSYNPVDYTYYFVGGTCPIGHGHAVTIVGWDDAKATAAANPGAWLIKNSWGTGWGDNGYFWISYDDARGANHGVSFRDAVSPTTYKQVYYHDEFGDVSSLNSPWGMNAFTPTAAEDLMSVGFFTQADGAGYDVRVYDTYSGGTLSGLLGSVTGTQTYAGYHTVELATPVALTTNDTVYISVHLTSGGTYPHAFDRRLAGYSSASTALPGQSYYSFNGTSWTDLTSYDSSANFCIKALTGTALPELSINDVTVDPEGHSGSTDATFTVTLSKASADTVTVDYATLNVTATAGADYTTTSDTLTFAPGQVTKTIDVPVLGDTLDEVDETFRVNLSNPTNATIGTALGTGTIVDDDLRPSLSINDATINPEGNTGTTTGTFTVTLSAVSGKTVTVQYATADDTATAGTDYVATANTLTFSPGDTQKQFTVSVIGDTDVEGNETFLVNLGTPTNATIAVGQGTGTIIDDDSAVTAIIGMKFQDSDGDGVKDPGEPGLNGWLIYLDSNGNDTYDVGVDTDYDTTNAQGEYAITGLSAGTYYVREVVKLGWVQSAPDAAADNEYVVTLADGETASDRDFGNYEPAYIDGTLFEDENGNGQKDGGEVWLHMLSWHVYLDANDSNTYDVGETETWSIPMNGFYGFNLLEPGTYVVRVEPEAGWTQSMPAAPDEYEVTLTSGQSATDRDFGHYQQGSISGVKFDDQNRDGSKAGDPVLDDWTIYIDVNTDGQLDAGDTQMQTAGGGIYSFAGLDPGTYVVREVLKDKWVQSLPGAGASFQYTVTITSGLDEVNKDFGNYRPSTIAGVKYHDLDGDGVKDAGEPGLPGWTIFLDQNQNTVLDGGEDWVTTNAQGEYLFPDLTANTYYVREVVTGVWVQSAPDAAANNRHVVVLGSGQDVTGKDFGNYQLGTIQGTKWKDLDGDGIKDAGEPGLDGWTVFLDTDGDGQLGGGETSTVTAGGGLYSFPNLKPGTYQVCEVLQGGWMQMYPAIRGSEFQVNSTTANAQRNAAVAVDPINGGFVIAWDSYDQDGDNWGVYAQMYAANGTANGAEFLVNTTTAGCQYNPSVAMDATGNFAITWASCDQDGSSWGVYAQMYNANGTANGAEFLVNTYTAGCQYNPSVAMAQTGEFAIVWDSYRQDGAGAGIYAQRYQANGTADGTEFRVNTTTAGWQSRPSVAMDGTGDFVVAWDSFGHGNGAQSAIYAQRYQANGTAAGGEFLVNTTTIGWQFSPSVAMDQAGNFVVAWDNFGKTGSYWCVNARRYQFDGVPLADEFQVNSYNTRGGGRSSVGMDPAGNFMVAWDSYTENGWAVYAEKYQANGTPEGPEFQANTTALTRVGSPAAAMGGLGSCVVTWENFGQDGDRQGVFAKQFTGGHTVILVSGVPSTDANFGNTDLYVIAQGQVDGVTVTIYDIDLSDGAGNPHVAWNRGEVIRGITEILVDPGRIGDNAIDAITLYGDGSETAGLGIVVEGNAGGLRRVQDLRTAALPMGFLISEGPVGTVNLTSGLVGLDLNAFTTPGGWNLSVANDIDGDGDPNDLIGLYAPAGAGRITIGGQVGADVVTGGLQGFTTRGNVANGVDLVFGGAAGDRLSFSAGVVGLDVDLTFAGTLTRATATSWAGAGSLINVAGMGSLVITGGHFAADLTITADGFNSIRVTGGDSTGTLNVAGAGGTFSVASDRLGNGGSITGTLTLPGGARRVEARGGNINLTDLTVGTNGISLLAREVRLPGGGTQGGSITIVNAAQVTGRASVSAWGGNVNFVTGLTATDNTYVYARGNVAGTLTITDGRTHRITAYGGNVALAGLDVTHGSVYVSATEVGGVGGEVAVPLLNVADGRLTMSARGGSIDIGATAATVSDNMYLSAYASRTVANTGNVTVRNLTATGGRHNRVTSSGGNVTFNNFDIQAGGLYLYANEARILGAYQGGQIGFDGVTLSITGAATFYGRGGDINVAVGKTLTVKGNVNSFRTTMGLAGTGGNITGSYDIQAGPLGSNQAGDLRYMSARGGDINLGTLNVAGWARLDASESRDPTTGNYNGGSVLSPTSITTGGRLTIYSRGGKIDVKATAGSDTRLYATASRTQLNTGDVDADLTVNGGRYHYISASGGDVTLSNLQVASGNVTVWARERAGAGGDATLGSVPNPVNVAGRLSVYAYGGDLTAVGQVANDTRLYARASRTQLNTGNIGASLNLTGGRYHSVYAYGGNVLFTGLNVAGGAGVRTFRVSATEMRLPAGTYQGGGIQFFNGGTIDANTSIDARGGNVTVNALLQVLRDMTRMSATKSRGGGGGGLMESANVGVDVQVGGVLRWLGTEKLNLDIKVNSLVSALLRDHCICDGPGAGISDDGTIEVTNQSGWVRGHADTFRIWQDNAIVYAYTPVP